MTFETGIGDGSGGHSPAPDLFPVPLSAVIERLDSLRERLNEHPGDDEWERLRIELDREMRDVILDLVARCPVV